MSAAAISSAWGKVSSISPVNAKGFCRIYIAGVSVTVRADDPGLVVLKKLTSGKKKKKVLIFFKMCPRRQGLELIFAIYTVTNRAMMKYFMEEFADGMLAECALATVGRRFLVANAL